MIQASLPDYDMRVICPACKQPTNVLGEWSPGSKKLVCRRCCELLQSGLEEVYDLASKNSMGIGLRREPEFAKERELYHVRTNFIFELAHGCQLTIDHVDADGYLPCMRTDVHLAQTNGGLGWKRAIDLGVADMNCRRCRNKVKYLVNVWQQAHRTRANRGMTMIVTEALPFCKRCGCVHDNRYDHIGGLQENCQHCTDLISVETFWRSRAIFGDDDMETIMDRIHRSHPHLFEHQVLPEYWFELALKEQQT